MKKLYATIGLFLASLVSAQVPQAFSYQTIAFNAAGAPIANGNVSLRISILDNAANGTVLYTETQNKTTNAKGLVNLNIGQGTATTGNFGAINWGTNAKFVKVELDPAGGSNYTNVGVNQLMSVPYAMVAKNVVDSNNIPINQLIPKKSNYMIVYTDTNAYAFYQNSGSNGSWYSQSLSGTVKGAIASNTNSIIYTNTNAYAFYQNSGSGGNWYSQSLSGTVKGAVASDNCIVVYTDTNAYAFYQNSGSGGSWYTQSLSGTVKGAVASAKNIVIYTDTDAYAFYQNSGSGGNWYPQSLSGTVIGADFSNSNIMVYTNTNAYSFYQNSGSGGNWYSQSLSGNVINSISK